MVDPLERRVEVARIEQEFGVSERRACRALGQPRRTQRYKAKKPALDGLRVAIRDYAYQRSRDGYRRVWDAMRLLYPAVGLRRVYRLYRLDGLTMKRRRPKRARRGQRVAMPAPTAPNHRWSMDFVHDQLVDGRCFRILNIIDDFKREAVAVVVDTSISGGRVARVLDNLATSRGLPKVMTCDNGSEFTSKTMQAWAVRHDVRLNFF